MNTAHPRAGSLAAFSSLFCWLALIQIGVGQAPTITAQPSGQTLYEGNNLILGAAVTGDALSYQWRFDSTPIAGQTNALLFLPMATTNNAGSYTLIITNSVGSITSAVA